MRLLNQRWEEFLGNNMGAFGGDRIPDRLLPHLGEYHLNRFQIDLQEKENEYVEGGIQVCPYYILSFLYKDQTVTLHVSDEIDHHAYSQEGKYSFSDFFETNEMEAILLSELFIRFSIAIYDFKSSI